MERDVVSAILQPQAAIDVYTFAAIQANIARAIEVKAPTTMRRFDSDEGIMGPGKRDDVVPCVDENLIVIWVEGIIPTAMCAAGWRSANVGAMVQPAAGRPCGGASTSRATQVL